MTAPSRFRVGRALALAVLPFLAAAPLAAQGTGRIAGKVLDAQTGEPVPGAQVEVATATTPIRATSAIDGRYTLLNVPEGTVALRVRMIGYQPKTVTGIVVTAGTVTGQDVTLPREVVELEEITVTAAAERGTVNRAIDDQRVAVNIVNSISAEQISKSPDSDAGEAIQRVSGVTVKDGGSVFVRGLGERYTNTNLNGSRLPSPDPEKKVVPLDLFPSNLLEGITTSKTFTPDQPGDFSGASVDLETREFPLGRVTTLSVSAGMNSAITGKNLRTAPRTGTELFGFAGDERALPAQLQGVTSLAGASQEQINAIIGSFRNAWTADQTTGAPSGSFAFSVGGEDPLFGQPIGYIGSLTYAFNPDVRQREQRAFATGGGDASLAINQYSGSSAGGNVLWGGLLNLSTRLGASSKLEFNNTYTRGAENEATVLAGYNDQFDDTFEITRLTFVERVVRSHQLKGQHQLGNRHFFDWTGSLSAVDRNEPDRADLVYFAERNAQDSLVPVFWSGQSQGATRTFSEVEEDALEGGLNYRILIGNATYQPSVKVGVLARSTSRDADSRAWDIFNRSLDEAERTQDAEVIFNGTYADDSRLNLFLNGNGGRYSASDDLLAGYVQVEYPLTTRLQFVGGVRVEQSNITVDAVDASGAASVSTLDDTDLLPAASLNYYLTPTHQFRISASQTLARPEYRELAPIYYFDILGGQSVFGNASLVRSLIQNFDLRWEWYPRTGELISAAVFYKNFQDPIERVLVPRAGDGAPDATFQNADGANNFGIELEARKGLDFLSRRLERFNVFTNLTLMQSDIRIAEGASSPTNPERAMVGQSEYVINAGLGYVSGNGKFSGTLLYNVAGPRIFEAGVNPTPDSYEEARDFLDLSASYDLMETMRLRVNAKNLLDSPYVMTQGEVIRLKYYTGRQFTFGVSMDL